MTDYLQKEVLGELKENFAGMISEGETYLGRALEKLYSVTRKGFVFIIDEWDCIFREKKSDKGAQTKYLDFLRDLLKDKPYVKLAYMTGILPIKKYGSHSALNMLYEEFDSYWTQTETYEALKIYIDSNYNGLRDAIIQMLGGHHCAIDTKTFQNDMMTFQSEDDVLTLLVHLGYLAYDGEYGEVFIPNEEVRAEFVRAVKNSGWEEVIRVLSVSEELLKSTLNSNGINQRRGQLNKLRISSM